MKVQNKSRNTECRQLVKHVKKVAFEYWLYKGIGESYSWYDRFDASDGSPQAVRILLEIDSKLKGDRIPVRREYDRVFLIPAGGKTSGEEEGFSLAGAGISL